MSTQDHFANRLGRWSLAAALVPVALLPASPPAEAGDTRGFIYGTVTTESGSTYEGRIRWGKEEAFWGDIFNSSKEELPYMDRVSRSERGKREPIRIFGIRVGMRWSDSDESRVFKTRFGDIAEIRPEWGDEATVVMKNGSEYRLDGGSNDLGGTIHVWDEGVGEIQLQWKKIESIRFGPTPTNLPVDEHRLHGTVVTDDGEFRGFIQWDQDECMSQDKLDGHSEDGKLALPMGNIRAIERRSSNSARVTLKDGREFVLDGTNDVDDGNRGIFVEDPRFGRVLVSWDAFERVDFSDAGKSGPAYKEFKPGKQLQASVLDVEGGTHRGRIAFDLDETETWEFLDGNRRDVAYAIPMGRIAAIVPGDGGSSRVILRNGEELELEGESDVGRGNAGVMVLDGDQEKVYLPWGKVKRIDFGG